MSLKEDIAIFLTGLFLAAIFVGVVRFIEMVIDA